MKEQLSKEVLRASVAASTAAVSQWFSVRQIGMCDQQQPVVRGINLYHKSRWILMDDSSPYISLGDILYQREKQQSES